MNCDEALQLLEQFVDRELTSEEITEVQRHLGACPPCLRLFHFEENLRRLVRRACNESAPSALRERIVSQSIGAETRD
ncbi:MAG TPA: mycothiol system anti-sigma-R factor [Chloroflexota bacterium]|nr:mycothiol system anti-sigma-R factor [Chloroflexota bacterium]